MQEVKQSPHPIRSVGVIGAGVMGAGVAQSLVQYGYRVTLVDHLATAIDGARAAIRSNLRFQTMFGQSKGTPAAPAAPAVPGPSGFDWSLLGSALELEAVADCDFIIENVTEDWAVKQPVYAQLDRLCAPHTIFAANTSAIPITRIGGATGRADRVVGIHFMNPVPQKPLVELIKGFHTSAETIDTTAAFLASFDKRHVLVNDASGFISNRVLMLTINEAIFLVHEGTSNARDIDLLFKGCFGHAMGPLETGDLIGLDTILQSLEVLLDAYNDPKFRPCPLLRKMVDAGLYGKKSGRGFYDY